MITNIRSFPRNLVTVAMSLFFIPAVAQFDYNYHRTSGIKPAGSFVPTQVQKQYAPVVTPQEMPYPGQGREAQRRRKLSRQKTLPVRHKARMNQAPLPEILDTLSGNDYNNSVPNDDAFAINKQGQLITVRNTSIGAYDVRTDSLLFETSLFYFYREPGNPLIGSKYDPRVIYDPVEDRFIVVYLNGTTFQLSTVVVGFSKTSNPVDGFNIYTLNGSPLSDSTWSDYPHISITEDDLFITMNTFYNGSVNNSGYVQSTIRQLNKSAGYDSLPLTQHYYSDLTYDERSLFNFTGATGGRSLKKDAYLIGNRSLAVQNDSIFLVNIKGNAVDTPQLSLDVFTTENPYGLPPEARQKNNHTFDCNDARVQGAFYQNDKIQFVGNTVTDQGNTGIYHGMIDLSAASREDIYFKILGFDTVDIGYPNLSYTGKSYFENEAIITFNHTGPNLNAGFSSLFFANDSTYSARQMVVKGQNYIDIVASSGDSTYERWGDYSGSQPVYGDTGVIYASGYRASATGQPQTAIVKLRSPTYKQSPVERDTATQNPDRAVEVSPNPSTNWFEVEFYSDTNTVLSFTLVSMNGQVASKKFTTEDYAMAGRNTFRFNTVNLRAGVYYLIIRNRKGDVREEKKIVIL